MAYNHKNTGRPLKEGKWFEKFRSNYLDVSNDPLYPFGYGLSYTTFQYSDITLSSKQLNADGKLTASVTVTNTGNYDADEIVQLYIRDLVGSITRPVKELKRLRAHPPEKRRKQAGDLHHYPRIAEVLQLRHTVCIRTRRVPCNDWTQQPRCKDYEF